MSQTFYTVEQVSSLIDLHPKTIQRYIREGKLEAQKIGKSYRITGDALSRFTGSNDFTSIIDSRESHIKLSTSSVVDITISHPQQATHLMNALTALANSKPSHYAQSSLQIQYSELTHVVRVSLWGDITFISQMLESINNLVSHYDNL